MMKRTVCFVVALVLYAYADPIEPISPSFDAFRDCRLLLTTRNNRDNPAIITFNDLNSIINSPYDRNRPLRISIHGWNADSNDGTHWTLSRALLDHSDFNFIFLDWSAGSSTINYITARNRVSEAGEFLGAFLDWLNVNGLVNFNEVTIIGFSLGAHVAGFAGKNVQTGKINTIFGLDPAGPLFSVDNPATRLDAGDAEYVEAIHTNGRANGIGAPIGDADFFPNGGNTQPGCVTGTGCSHSRAVHFYLESITSSTNNFRASRCTTLENANNGDCVNESGIFMGGDPSNQGNHLRGIFFLVTNANSPFGQG